MFLQIISLVKCIFPLGAAMALKILSRVVIVREIVTFINAKEELVSSACSLSSLKIAGAATISQFLVSALMALSERMHQSEGAKLVQNTQQRLLRKSLKVSFEPGEGWNGLNRSDLSRMINQESTQLTTYYQAFAFIFVFPFSISQPLYVLYCKLGWYCFVVIAVLLTIFYLSSLFTRGMGASLISAQDQLKKRSALVQSISENMRYVRGSNLEQVFEKQLEKVREKELQQINKLFFMQDAKLFFLKLSQPFSMAAIFLYFIFIEPSVIDIELLYTLEQAFWTIRAGLGQYPKFLFIYLTQSKILQRFKSFLNSQEINQKLKIEDTSNKLLLHCPNSAPSVNIQVNEGQIIVVKGPTGSGKTVLLQGLLGELGGNISKWSNIGFVGQDNWLKADSLRKNITLEDENNTTETSDQDWFSKIVNAFELHNDFSNFEKVISASNDNISGGQKQRICLARAFYKKSNKLILLDDSFCSLDRKVLSRILDNIRKFLLEDRIIVITVSSSDLVESAADVIVQLSADHNILQIQEINRQQKEVTSILNDNNQNNLTPNETSEDDMISEQKILDLNNQQNQTDQGTLIEQSFETLIQNQTNESTDLNSTTDSQPQSQVNLNDKTIQSPQLSTSNSGAALRFLKSLKRYACIDSGVTKYLILAIISISIYNCFYFGENYILMNWNILGFSQEHKILLYLAITVLGSLSQILRLIFAKKQALIASRTVHKLACRTLLQADFQEYLDQNITPHRFNDTLTTQLYGLDYFLGLEMSSFIFQLAQLFNAIVLTLYGSIGNTITLLSVGGFLFMGLKLSQRRVEDQETVSREIRQAEEPLSSFVQESLKGLITIRAFHLEEQTIKHYINLQNNKRKWSQFSYTQGFKRDIELAVLTLFVNFMSLWSSLSGFTPQAAISKVSSNSQIDSNTLASVKMCNQLSGYLSSFNFVMEYLSTLKQQKSQQVTLTNNKSAKNTNNQGASIQFEDYSAAYNKTAFNNKVFALKNISLKITQGEKVCIIGRTGSGKSSLVFSILQLFGYSTGKIKIGGEQREGQESRNLVEVIQQDSPIFEGTVRQNIDPKGLFTSDESLIEFMKSQNLEELLIESGIELSTNLTEGGKNLSSGQLQLIALIRALLQEKPILIFDEANSKIDANLETKVFELLFKRHATVIFIAHRLGLAHMFQRVICMEEGNIVEDGSPNELLENANSRFGQLIRSKINQLN